MKKLNSRQIDRIHELIDEMEEAFYNEVLLDLADPLDPSIENDPELVMKDIEEMGVAINDYANLVLDGYRLFIQA